MSKVQEQPSFYTEHSHFVTLAESMFSVKEHAQQNSTFDLIQREGVAKVEYLKWHGQGDYCVVLCKDGLSEISFLVSFSLVEPLANNTMIFNIVLDSEVTDHRCLTTTSSLKGRCYIMLHHVTSCYVMLQVRSLTGEMLLTWSVA